MRRTPRVPLLILAGLAVLAPATAGAVGLLPGSVVIQDGPLAVELRALGSAPVLPAGAVVNGCVYDNLYFCLGISPGDVPGAVVMLFEVENTGSVGVDTLQLSTSAPFPAPLPYQRWGGFLPGSSEPDGKADVGLALGVVGSAIPPIVAFDLGAGDLLDPGETSNVFFIGFDPPGPSPGDLWTITATSAGGTYQASVEAAVVPEPGATVLLALGALLAAQRRRRAA